MIQMKNTLQVIYHFTCCLINWTSKSRITGQMNNKRVRMLLKNSKLFEWIK